jgi:hypothetical protein
VELTVLRDGLGQRYVMTLHPRKSPAVFSALCGGVVLALASILPIWDGFCVPHARRGQSLWLLLQHLLDDPEFFEKEMTWQRQKSNLVRLAVFYCIGGIAGRMYYWLGWEPRRTGPGE